MTALKDKLAEQARIKAELQRMEGSEDTTEETDGDYRDTLIERWTQLDTEVKPIVERMARIQAITRTADDDASLERPYGKDGPDLQIQSGRSPYDNLEAVRQNLVPRSEIRGRAFDAVELEVKRGNLPHDQAEIATQRAQENTGVAQHILKTGSQEYQDAFRAYLEDPEGQKGTFGYAERTALILSGGAAMLPFVLDPTIVLTNTGSANPWRRISNVKQTTSNTWNGVTSAGVNAAWLTEGTIVTDGTPAVAAIAITPVKAAAWVYGSYEFLEDTDFGQQLPRLLADAKDRIEEAAFATGAGTGGVPSGVITGATTVITTATTLVIAVGDIYNVQGALPPRFRNAPSCAWVANVGIINKFRQLDTAGGASFWTNLGKGQPETLIGAPIYESTTMQSTVTSTGLLAVMGDFSQFFIVDRVGVSLIYEPLVKGTGGILPAGEAGWFMFWRTGSLVAVPNAFRVMKGL